MFKSSAHPSYRLPPGVHSFGGAKSTAVTTQPNIQIPAPINDLIDPHIQINPPPSDWGKYEYKSP